MNKKDLKELAKKSDPSAGDEPTKALLTKQDLVDAISAAVEKMNGNPADDRVKDPVWWKMYVSVIGGQVYWLSEAMNNEKKFVGRLEILANMAKAATNYAIRRGIVAPRPESKK